MRRLLPVILLVSLASACGKNVTGSYSGTESLSSQNMGSQSLQITMNLQQNSSDQVTGTWSDQTGTGSVQGQMVSGTLTNMVFSSGGSMYGGSMGGTGGCGYYMGNLSVGSNNQITGTLNATQGCTGSKTLNVVRTN